MRIVEIFTSFGSLKKQVPDGSNEVQVVKFLKRLFSYMIDQNYFAIVRKMIDEKVSENTYDVDSVTPHNEISRVLLQMIERPLKLVNTFNADPLFDSKILSSFTIEFLTKDFNRTISNFIVPALGAQTEFPFIKLVQFLHDIHKETVRGTERFLTDQSVNSEVNLNNIKFNAYLLYSLLKLDTIFLDKMVDQNCLSQYLIVIGAMVGNISRLPKPSQYVTFSNYYDDDAIQDSDSDQDSHDDDEDMQPQFERLILSDTIVQLNEQTRVGKIVKNIDGLLYIPEVVHSLCLISHNLMIYNRSARVNEYR